MNVKELYNYLGKLDPDSQHWDDEIVISLDYPSMGGRITESVIRTNFGFDWDSGKCFLVTENKLVKSFKNKTSESITLESIELKNFKNPKNPE